MSKRALGKGLDALIPISSREYGEDLEKDIGLRDDRKILELQINDIDPNPDQPREDFDIEKIEELALSIERHGVIQPILVRPHGDRYLIIAGERRWRAGKLAGLDKIPAIVRELDDKDMYMLALVENLQREDLDPIEEAKGIRQLMDEYNLTQDQISMEVGKSRSAIANIVRLLNLPKWVQEKIKEGKISSGHGRAILALKDRQHMENVIREIIEKDLNVRETELLIKQLNSPKRSKEKTSIKKPNYLLEIESNLEESLGTKVNITPGKKKSVIQIEYYNDDDLQRIIDVIESNR